tara:strand:- start:7106 stop:7237 length:132 start_codon:yes stop_codon:yes gene_type:complete
LRHFFFFFNKDVSVFACFACDLDALRKPDATFLTFAFVRLFII